MNTVDILGCDELMFLLSVVTLILCIFTCIATTPNKCTCFEVVTLRMILEEVFSQPIQQSDGWGIG